MHIAYLLLGGNLGDSLKYLSDARKIIGERFGELTQTSDYYLTEAWGKRDQPEFLNQVVALKTDLEAGDLLNLILALEEELGRRRQERWDSRTIDIDILLFDDQIINTSSLKVPHPFLHERRFALEPLAEIAPDFIHPKLNKTVAVLLAELEDDLLVKKLS